MCKKLLLFIFTINLLQAREISQKLNIEILYESLCPDSSKFITQQLQPVWKELSPYVNLKLVPFGKSASLQNGAEFICQHGPKECQGNKIQSCALEMIKNQDEQVAYVDCFMRNYRREKDNQPEKLCAESLNLNTCINSEQGTSLQLMAESATAIHKPRFIPTIIYNGIFDPELQEASLKDFRQVVCFLLNSDACQKPFILRL